MVIPSLVLLCCLLERKLIRKLFVSSLNFRLV